MFRIITITYNRRQLLEKAIRSVLAQTYSEFEYYVIDDGSTDDTAAMIAGFHDKRLTYLLSENTGGHLARLRNLGMQNTHNRVLAFLDSDDYWEPAYLAQLARLYEQPQLHSVIANATIHKSPGPEILFGEELLLQAKKNPFKTRLLNDRFVIYPSCFSFRQQQPPLLFNPELRHGDSDLFLRLLGTGEAAVLGQPLVNILKHDTNMSANMGENAPFIQTFVEEFKTLTLLKQAGKISWWVSARTRSRYFEQLAGNYLQINRPADASANYLRAFCAFPLHAKALVKFFYNLRRRS